MSTMEQLNFNNYNIVLPPVHKVMLPPPSQIWEYNNNGGMRMQYNTNPVGNGPSNGVSQLQQMQQMQQMQQQLQQQSQQQSQQSQQLQQQAQLQAQQQLQQQQLQQQLQQQQQSQSMQQQQQSQIPAHIHQAPQYANFYDSAATSLGTNTPITQTPSPTDHMQPMLQLNGAHSSTTTSSLSNSVTNADASKFKAKKPRKKRQCPECSMWFSNLSTHRAIHLTPENRPYLCQICGRGFSRSNDLFRHSKRHWKEMGDDKGAFKCPFNTNLFGSGELNKETSSLVPCHPTGIFSRCDTYKNHLKALHFEYPQGTKKKDRAGV